MACGPNGSSFRIRGSFRDMQSGELYVYNQSGNNARLDTLAIQKGEFLYKGTAQEVTPYVLVFPNGVEQVIFVGPGADLKYEATANDLKNYVVNGSEENKLMNRFRQETYTQKPALVKRTANAYIREYAESPVAVYLLDQYFVQDERVDGEELLALLKELKKKQPHNHYLLDVESKVKNASRGQLGKVLPDVALTKKDRSTVKLWDKQKDYTLIAFWSLWSNNGYDMLWKLRRNNDEFAADGRLRIVAVSLDVERYRWEEAIRTDSVSAIEHYCDGMSFESKAVKTFGIDVLPYFILVDKNHKVLERSGELADMDKVLKKYLR